MLTWLTTPDSEYVVAGNGQWLINGKVYQLTPIQHNLLSMIWSKYCREWVMIADEIRNNFPETRNPKFNWLIVRGDLQALINMGWVKRIRSVQKEAYCIAHGVAIS